MRVLIIGNGVAGVTTAATIAKNQPDSEIHIYSAEPYLYYPRPKLWDFLRGKLALEDLYFYPKTWYEQRGIKVHLGVSAVELRPNDKTVILSDGSTARYDRLVLATGAIPFVPPIENVQLPGVFTLRTIEDALAIREYASDARRAVVIGGGLLGLESARGLRDLGLNVTVVEVFAWLLPRQLDEPGGAVLQAQFERMGIHTITNVVSQAIIGERRATGVLLKDGQRIPGDIILISAGVRCNVSLAQAAGLAVNRGVIVDPTMRTSAPDIYAAGDIIEFEGKTYGIIPPAIEQARVAGANVVNPNTVLYKGTVPTNTLKVVGIDLTTVGLINAPDETYQEFRASDPERGIYKKFVVHNGKLVGAILMGVPKSVSRITYLIRDDQPLTEPVESLLAANS